MDKDLQKKVEKLQQELIDLNEKLLWSEKMKTNFISNVMNEMVNPFASVLALSDQIMNTSESDFNLEKVKKMAGLIHQDAFDLDFQMQNIFEAAKIEAGTNEVFYQSLSLENTIKNILQVYQLRNPEYNIQLGECAGIEIYSHAPSIRLILSNLLSNAIKNSSVSDLILIRCQSIENEVLIEVLDQGKGMNQDEVDTIYNRFQKVDQSIHNNNKGYGLGLSVVLAAIEQLNGRIDLHSKPNKGSVFQVYLPINESIGSENQEDDFLIDEMDF